MNGVSRLDKNNFHSHASYSQSQGKNVFIKKDCQLKLACVRIKAKTRLQNGHRGVKSDIFLSSHNSQPLRYSDLFFYTSLTMFMISKVDLYHM